VIAAFVGGQEKLSEAEKAKLVRADKIAARIVERFRQTRDFGIVWREFRVKDTQCAIRLTPALDIYSGIELKEKSFEERLREKGLDEQILDQLYVTSWNASLLFQGYHYSYALSRNGSEPAEFPDRTTALRYKPFRDSIRNIYCEFDSDDDNSVEVEKPPSRRTAKKMIASAQKTGRVFKKYLPRDFLRTKNWQSAITWFERVHKVGGQVIDREEFAEYCAAGKGPLFGSQIGYFVFIFAEEDGRMKLWSMSLIDD